MKKIYVTDLISQTQYSSWLEGKKVIIAAPTGMGKTTFILSEFLPYCKLRGKKVLILCNRRLLWEQYDFDLAERYARYAEMQTDVEVSTYQKLIAKIRCSSYIDNLFSGYDVIIFDEVHYFYSDADFNAEGTYILLQALIKAAYYKTVIMITATLKEVLPIIERTFFQCKSKIERETGVFPGFEKYAYKGKIYNFEAYRDYDRFQCIFVPDLESLADEISHSVGKTLIFLDDIKKAEDFKAMLTKDGVMDTKEVSLLTAQILEEKTDSPIVRHLVISHKLLTKVVITTSVLDNGVSVHDPELENVVITTESRVSFIQMLGRVRDETTETCKLFLFPRSSQYYDYRMKQYTERMNWYKDLERKILQGKSFELLSQGWFDDDEQSHFLRNAAVISKDDREFYSENKAYAYLRRGDMVISVNQFAKEKTGNMLNAEKKLYCLSMEDPAKVAIEQISWIGKSPEELKIVDSTYHDRRLNELRTKLLEVINFSSEKLQIFKAELAKEFRRDLIGDIVFKNGSFSNEKLKEICERNGLSFHQEVVEKKTIYNIAEKIKEEELV
ncbi:MAG: DEAD/DEAH box helicase family protein [Eubacteriales bacterium]|nr:DEAD/DEAH box helicase family protein [Eubacteriales bacterium]